MLPPGSPRRSGVAARSVAAAAVAGSAPVGAATAASAAGRPLHSAYALMVCECTPVALGWMGGLAAVYWFSSRLGTTAFLALCWVCAFTLPVGYSKKQAEVDGLVATAKSKASEVWATAKSKIPTKGEKAPEEKKAD